MADAKSAGLWNDAGLSVFNTLWQWTSTSETWRLVLFGAILLVAILVAVTAFLGALSKFIDGIAKLADLVKSSWLGRLQGKASRAILRRRSQFCSALKSDLASIAKAESWNDQYFTDLEAEVETEGAYYQSTLHRLFGKESQGLRKEKSLIRAIRSSNERAIQLTGEPGAGKSVALRHLAMQLAIRAEKSGSKKSLVPLYINLREISIPDGTRVSVDAIRDFILDHIRRGDSDTAAYVRENWADYRERGIWFFLFDSFDEIPAVLHAEKGSAATKDYSEAIRMFPEGMGACRGILASREFKGPEALPWEKFRIIPLTSKKQQELVSNAFLTPSQERVVLHHLASHASSLANTPMFLTLLCKYVKEYDAAPKNDYELLSLQIDRLAHREPHYLMRNYGLTPAELIVGAQRIAQLFAEEPTLGLAPTIDQVEDTLGTAELPGRSVERFVSALVDSKIARADVKNAALGDRRFAFAHRRYQEALFVRHLVLNPDHISGEELLTDPRWREYAVTLLETQPTEALVHMFEAAKWLLTLATKSQVRYRALEPLENDCGYFDWSDDACELLTLLQEGLARRSDVIPDTLANGVEAFLLPRWTLGDSFDRSRVIRVAGLVPQPRLIAWLEEAFATGSEAAQDQAFKKTTAVLGSPPEAVRAAVLKRLSSEILNAKDRAALLRVDALSARLPEELGASFVLRRCVVLWHLTRAIGRATSVLSPAPAAEIIRTLLHSGSGRRNDSTKNTRAALMFGAISIMYMPILLGLAFSSPQTAGGEAVTLSSLFTAISNEQPLRLKISPTMSTLLLYGTTLTVLVYLIFPIQYRFRAVGQRLSPSFFVHRLGNRRAILLFVKTVLATMAIGAGAGLATYGTGSLASWLLTELFGITVSAPPLILGLAVVVTALLGTLLFAKWMMHKKQIKTRKAFDSLLSTYSGRGYRVLLLAASTKQFEAWLALWLADMRNGRIESDVLAQLRSLSAALLHIQRGGSLPRRSARFLSRQPTPTELVDCVSAVEAAWNEKWREAEPAVNTSK